MKRIFSIGSLFIASLAYSQTAVLPVYNCAQNGTQAITSGLKSSNYQLGVVPYCQVTVFLTGTHTIATTNPQTPLTAKSDGSIPPIYATMGTGYDVVFSGGIYPNVYTNPVTLTGLQVGGSGGGAITAVTGTSPIIATTSGSSVDISCPTCGSGGGGITALTGDVTASGTGSVAATLATVNSSPGTCGDSTHVCQITDNGKGLTTAQTAVSIGGVSQIVSGTNVTISPSEGTGVVTINSGNSGIGVSQIIAGDNITISPSGGTGAVTVNSGSGLGNMVFTPPISGQYVVLPADTSVSSTGNASASKYGNKISGTLYAPGVLANYVNFTFSAPALPSYINPANITAIYAVYSSIASGYFDAAMCPYNIITGGYQENKLISTDSGGLSYTCSGWIGQNGGNGATISEEMSFYVYYTGTAPPDSPKYTSVVYPLSYDGSANTLSLILPYDYSIDNGLVNEVQVTNPAFSLKIIISGDEIKFKAKYSNTSTTPTITWNGLGPITVTKCDQHPLAVGDYTTTSIPDVTFNGTYWELNNPISGCGGGGLSGMTTGQVPIAATSSTVTSSKALAGTGTGIATGPTSTTANDCVEFGDTAGTLADAGAGCGGGGSMTWPTFTGLAKYSGSSSWSTPTYADVTALWTTCTGYLKSNGTCDSGGGGGVASVTGTSPIVATTSGSTVDISCPTCGSGGGGLIAGANVVFSGESLLLDDSGNTLGSVITATAVTCASNGVCTITSPNPPSANQWIKSTGIDPSCLADGAPGVGYHGTGTELFQVLSSIPSTSFQIQTQCSSTTGTGGTFEDATYFLPVQTVSQPAFKGINAWYLRNGKDIASIYSGYTGLVCEEATNFMAMYGDILPNSHPVNQIPVMTSNTTPSGTVSVSSYANSSYQGWMAMDNTDLGWITDSTPTGWIQYQFPSALTITSYSITPWSADNFPSRSPAAWTLQASNDGSTWSILDTRSVSSSIWTLNTATTFAISSPGSYAYYRLNVTANGGDDVLALRRFQLNTTTSGTGVPLYILEEGSANDISRSINDPTPIENCFKSLWSQAHANGVIVIQNTIIRYSSYDILTLEVNNWLVDQGKSMSNAVSGQYWDYPGVDMGRLAGKMSDNPIPAPIIARMAQAWNASISSPGTSGITDGHTSYNGICTPGNVSISNGLITNCN